jgi:hypothetical protein
VSAKPAEPSRRNVPLAHFVHCESVSELQVRALSQLVTPVHRTHESAALGDPCSRNVPLAHSVHLDVVALVHVSSTTHDVMSVHSTQESAS